MLGIGFPRLSVVRCIARSSSQAMASILQKFWTIFRYSPSCFSYSPSCEPFSPSGEGLMGEAFTGATKGGQPSLYARVYTQFIPRKKCSPLHRPNVYCWKPDVSSVKAWWFKAFTRCHSIHSRPVNAVNTWKSKPSHLKRLKFRRKMTMCEGVNTFFGF